MLWNLIDIPSKNIDLKNKEYQYLGVSCCQKPYHPQIILTIARIWNFLLLVMLNSLVHSGRYYSNTVQLSLTLLHSLMAITFVKFMTKILERLILSSNHLER